MKKIFPAARPACCRSLFLAMLCALWFSNITAQTTHAPKDYFLLTGGYSDRQEIVVYKLNYASARLDSVTAVPGIKNASFLCLSPDKKKMYSIGELDNGGAVHSFSFNDHTGTLQLLQSTSSGGAGPCNITTDHTGKWLFISNYSGGSFSIIPAGNFAGVETSTTHYQGKSILPQQNASHIHSVTVSRDNKHIYVADLGTDSIYHYAFNAATGTATPAPGSKEPAGSGPRHMSLHPGGRYAYCIHELSCTVSAYKLVNGNLQTIQSVSSLPADYTGRKWGADIHVSPNGKFLYASNRAHESIVIYSISPATGLLTLVGFEIIKGKTPRNFTIDPTGKYLLVANQESNNVLVYEIDPKTGKLRFTGSELNTSKPSCLSLVPVAG